MIDPATLITYATVVLGLFLIPGPAVLLTLARATAAGPRAGIATGLGIATGDLGHTIMASFGLAAVLATSALAFNVVKFAGAGYLLFLGIRALLERSDDLQLGSARAVGMGRAFRQGVMTELLNPKTALFFLAFLPHFVQPGTTHPILVFALLGTIAVVMAMAVDLLVAFGAGRIGETLGRRPHWQRRQRITTGVTMIGLGGALALAEQG
jgi:threonine/homoserine/homoserine lactone efflux protein